MIIEGNSRRNGKWFTTHIQRTDQGQQVSIAEVRGLAGDSIRGWFVQMEAMALETRGENYFYHANIDPRADEHMTEEQWEHAVDTLEHNLGLDGQPRFVVEHEKDGRTHRHVFWARADMNGDGLIRDSHNYDIHQRTADQLEEEFGHERTPRGREPGKSKGPKNYEYFRGKAANLTVEQVHAELTAAWHQADSPQAFAAAIAEEGYILCEGRRGLCVVDPAAKEHSLYRRLDLRKKELDPRMEAIDREALPTVEEARAMARERLKGKGRDEAQAQSDHRKRDAAIEVVAEEIADAAGKALNGKNKEHHTREEPRAEEPSAGGKRAEGGPEPSHDGPSEAQTAPPPFPGPEPSAGASTAIPAAADDDGRLAAPLSPPKTDAEPRPAPSAFERLADMLSKAGKLLSRGATAAEAADLTAPLESPPEYPAGIPWGSTPPDLVPSASAPTAFERLVGELARGAQAAAPAVEDAAFVASVIAEPGLPEFDRVAQALGEWIAAPSPGASLDWLAREIGQPPVARAVAHSELTPFERLERDLSHAMRKNGGEPEPGFWQRGVALLAAAGERALEWVREKAQDFVGRILQQRSNRGHNSDLER